MEDIFYNGVWRMDWGFGNPNKTATLIAEFIVALWGLAYLCRWGFWVALGFFTLLGGCLIHTFSRGGLIAAFLGLTALIICIPRPWPIKKYISIVISLFMLISFSLYIKAYQRYTQCILMEDHSITNRILLWENTPAMMVDAPSGWGIGNSGKAFMQWYQTPEDNEQYRTLVNSHLTWLVELGWSMRFVYLFSWFAVILLCLPTKEAEWRAASLGIWIAFGVAATFSSVAETIWLWIIPGLSLGIVLGHRLLTKQWPHLKAWFFPTSVAFLLCLIFLSLGNLN